MVHSLAEEEVLYPEFKNMMGSKCRDHALSEHKTLKNLLMDLNAMTINSPGFKVRRVNCVHALPSLLACTAAESHCCASLHLSGNAAEQAHQPAPCGSSGSCNSLPSLHVWRWCWLMQASMCSAVCASLHPLLHWQAMQAVN